MYYGYVCVNKGIDDFIYECIVVSFEVLIY